MTIKDYAAFINVTPQAIYKKLKDNHQPTAELVDAETKQLTPSGLARLDELFANKVAKLETTTDVEQVAAQLPTNTDNQRLQTEVDRLRLALDAEKEQHAAQKKANEALAAQLDRANDKLATLNDEVERWHDMATMLAEKIPALTAVEQPAPDTEQNTVGKEDEKKQNFGKIAYISITIAAITATICGIWYVAHTILH